SSLMSKTYLKSDHFNGGGSITRSTITQCRTASCVKWRTGGSDDALTPIRDLRWDHRAAADRCNRADPRRTYRTSSGRTAIPIVLQREGTVPRPASTRGDTTTYTN